MSRSIISVENLGKRYRLQHLQQGRYVALRDVVSARLRSPFSRREPSTGTEDFWALTDVSFDVKEGEVVGVIGRNGAGKSTLLKILSRITEPTTGRVKLHGRVASLLEVGTGFHPELTGRENIFLNGAILGMKRTEIAKKFDEIVAFAEVETFLDTPVKRYSSGMYVRLAFSVAAHMEPEILVVDEVLAVGDARFQRKCLGKMNDVARSGRTVLFVSHQIAAVENLCKRGLLLDQGRLMYSGSALGAISEYVRHTADGVAPSLATRADRQGNGLLRFTDIRFGCKSVNSDALVAGADGYADLRLRNVQNRPLSNVHVSIGVDNALGQRITTWSTTYAGGDWSSLPASDVYVRLILPRLGLIPGEYSFNLFSTVNGDVADWLRPGGYFRVEPGDYFGSGQLPGSRDGVFVSDHCFTLQSPADEGTGEETVALSI